MIYIRKETKISEEAKKWVKKNKKELIEKFAGDSVCQTVSDPSTVFMAGSPGAGKTEFSRNLIREQRLAVVRIDPDDIRKMLPQYTGRNSDEVQGAASLGVEKLYDYVLEKKKSAIIDGTFSNYDVSARNIRRSLEKERSVALFYIYQDPKVAWEFTQMREKEEGRYVPKDMFIDAFFRARENVVRAKREFGDKIRLHLAEKDYKNGTKLVYADAEDVDGRIKIIYNKTTIRKLL